MRAAIRLLPLIVLLPSWVRAQEPLTPAETRTAFLKMLDRPRVDLDPKVKESIRDGKGWVLERLDFASEKHPDGSFERVPTLIMRPENPQGRRPAVLVLHGTGGTKEGMRSWLDALASRGIIGVAIDARFHGERSGGAKGAEAYVAAITRAWKSKPPEPQTHPFYYDTCWDIWRTADYLATRPDVDPERIGIVGTSMGGIQTWLAAAVDERYKVVAPLIGVQSFRWSLENENWQGRAKTIAAAHEAAARSLGKTKVDAEVCRVLWNKVIPGMLDRFDCPNMLRLFAGRPMIVTNGELDPNCPLPGAEIAFASARKAYADAKAEEKLKIDVAKGTAHAVTSEQRAMVLDWFKTWLKP